METVKFLSAEAVRSNFLLLRNSFRIVPRIYRLFPLIRQASRETVIAVSGISCRQQVEHFTDRRPQHMAEVLVSQIGDGGTKQS